MLVRHSLQMTAVGESDDTLTTDLEDFPTLFSTFSVKAVVLMWSLLPVLVSEYL